MAVTLVPTALRVAVILIAIAAAAGHVAYIDSLWWHTGLTSTVAQVVPGPTLVLHVVRAVVAALCSVLAVILVLSERQYQMASRALAMAFAAWAYVLAYPGITLLFRPPVPGWEREFFEAHFRILEMVGLVGVIRFSSIFPRELHGEELDPLPTLPSVLLPFHHAAVFMRRPWAPPIAAALALGAAWTLVLASGGRMSDAALHPFINVVRFLAVGLVVMNLRRAWAVATEGDRDGMTWLFVALAYLVASLALLIGGNVLVAVTGWPEPGVAWRPFLLEIGSVGFFVSLALSVMGRHSSDPNRLVRRIAAVSVVATAGLFLAAGLEALFGGGLVSGMRLRGGIGTAVAFAVILSTWRQLERLIGRVLPV